MADKVEQPDIAASVAAPAPAPEPSPVIPESVAPAQADQVVAASPAPVAASPPVAAGAEAIPPVTENAAPAEPVAEPTLLEKFDAEKAAAAAKDKPAAEAPKPAAEAKPEAKAEEPKPGEPEKAAEAAPVELPKVDYFAAEGGIKLPETLKLDDTTKGEVVTAFDLLRTDPAKGAQALVDLHNKQMTDFAEQVRRDQWKTFNDTRKDWQTQVMADPEMGGARFQTTMQSIAVARDNLVSRHRQGTPQYQADMDAFNDFCKVTGAADHPAFIKLMNNAARYVGEQTVTPPNPRPAPQAKPSGKRDIYTNTQFPK